MAFSVIDIIWQTLFELLHLLVTFTILHISVKMDNFMVNHLKKDELKFELLIRGIATSDDQRVDDLRSCLRRLLKLEKSGKSLSPTPIFNLTLIVKR